MAFRRRPEEQVPQEETVIWTCTNDDCSCWSRDDFSSQDKTTCPICNSEMIQGTKVLPVIS